MPCTGVITFTTQTSSPVVLVKRIGYVLGDNLTSAMIGLSSPPKDFILPLGVTPRVVPVAVQIMALSAALAASAESKKSSLTFEVYVAPQNSNIFSRVKAELLLPLPDMNVKAAQNASISFKRGPVVEPNSQLVVLCFSRCAQISGTPSAVVSLAVLP